MRLVPDEVVDARAVLIAGPTASGKSVAALAMADRAGARGRAALVVNADSMQVYDALSVLTARPGAAEEARAPHYLYGHIPAERRYSVGAWLDEIRPLLAGAEAAGVLPIIVGGTGLYFQALTEGLAATPAVPPEVRSRWGARLAAVGPAALHAELMSRDGEAARAIRPTDPQRILRALEVLDATGRSLVAWQRERAAPPLLPAGGGLRIVLEPDRDVLYRRIEARLDRMLGEGAAEEVAALVARDLPPDLPVLKAIGVKEIGAALRGEISMEEALQQAKTASRRYAKRQLTWLRNQMPDWRRMPG